MSISLEMAEKMADAAKSKALSLGCAVSVAIVDNGGFVLTVSRMDGALALSADASINMAYTAAMFGKDGVKIIPFVSRPWFQSMVISTSGKIVAAEGEMPIMIGDTVVGGIGAAGASSDQDVACCLAAIKAFNDEAD